MHTVKTHRSRIKDYPYQLIDWQPTITKLDNFIEPFEKYSEESDGIIVKSPLGYAIFTTGKNRIRGVYNKHGEFTPKKIVED